MMCPQRAWNLPSELREMPRNSRGAARARARLSAPFRDFQGGIDLPGCGNVSIEVLYGLTMIDLHQKTSNFSVAIICGQWDGQNPVPPFLASRLVFGVLTYQSLGDFVMLVITPSNRSDAQQQVGDTQSQRDHAT